MKLSRPSSNFGKQFSQNVLRNTSGRPPKSWYHDLIDLEFVLSKRIVSVRYDFLIVFFVLFSKLIFKLGETFRRDHALLDEFVRVYIVDAAVVLDLFVHQRLGKVGLVLLVVPVSPVAHDIDEDVLLEFLAVVHCYLHTLVEDVRLISVDVNYGRINCLRHFGAVVRRSALVGISRKSYLVIQDDMYYTSRAVIH